MGGMRKLRRSGHSRHYRLEPLRPKDLCFDRKMSEVIMDFAEPLLDPVEDGLAFENALTLAVICWNTSFLPEEEQRKMVREMVGEMAKSDFLTRFEVENCINMLLGRKRTFFADERRLVLDYKIVEEKGRERLLVLSALAKD
jgi:hypothetical protein